MNKKGKLVSVVISTYKVAMIPNLLEAVRSVLRQSYERVEVLVVADEKPKLLSLLKKYLPPEVSLHVNKKSGLSAARNVGIEHAKGEIVAFLDDDAVAHPDWIGNLIKQYKDPSTIGVGGKIIPIFDEHANVWFPGELNWIVGATYKADANQTREVRNLMGCNMSFRREQLEEVEGFSEKFGKVKGDHAFHDDTDISLRLRDRFERSKLVYTPKAVVYHKVEDYRTTLSHIISRSYMEGKSKSHLMREKTHSDPSKKLAVEESYLTYLLRDAIPSRFKKIPEKPRNLISLGAIILSIASAGLGYLFSS